MTKGYALYLQSDHWQELRERVLVRDRFRCQDCGAQNRLAVHHLTYQRLGHERLADLLTLCRGCHHERHRTGNAPGRKHRSVAVRRWLDRVFEPLDPAELLPSRSHSAGIESAEARRARLDQERQEHERLQRERRMPLDEALRDAGRRIA